MKNKITIKEATQEWINGFNAIPQSLIEKAYICNNIYDLSEITPITVGDWVWSNEYQGEYEVVSINKQNETAVIKIDGEDTEVKLDDLNLEYDELLPMWGTMWTFKDSADNWWIENHLQEMAECGFRIYESDELGYFFGINGAGYSFYEHHWIPLYKARGLKWHDEE